MTGYALAYSLQSQLARVGLNADRTTAQHDSTVGRGVCVPSCCAVAGQIPFAACMKTAIHSFFKMSSSNFKLLLKQDFTLV